MVKVENEGVRRILGSYVEQANAAKLRDAQAKKREAGEADEVVVSDRARELQRVYRRLEEIENARREKVEAVRREIEAGTYKVRGDAIARKLTTKPS